MDSGIIILISVAVLIVAALAFRIFVSKRRENKDDVVSSRMVTVRKDVHASANIGKNRKKPIDENISDDVELINVAIGAIAISELIDASNDSNTIESDDSIPSEVFSSEGSWAAGSSTSWEGSDTSDWD